MTPPHFEQKRFLSHRSVSLDRDGVTFRYKGPFRSGSHFVPYASIPPDAVTVTSYSKVAMWIAIVTTGCAVFLLGDYFVEHDKESLSSSLFYVFFAVVFGVRFLVSRTHLSGYFCGDRAILLFAHAPSTEAVQSFLTRLRDHAHQYVLAQAPPPGLSPMDELTRLVWLREQGAISQEELEALKRRILASDQAGSPPEPTPSESVN